MPTVGQVYYNVIDNNSGSYVSSGQNIFSDIIAQVGASQFNKVGVQAPAGTKIVMNESKTIMVGRTGIYELDDDIAITNMYFIRPRKYEKDEEASQQAIEQGTEGMQAADKKRADDLKQFYKENPVMPDPDTDPEGYRAYWDSYNNIQTTYIEAYQTALSLYNYGVNGIYVLPNPDNIDAPENYQDLYNVIIDFIYV